MAYRNLLAESFSTKAEAFQRFRDWLCRRHGTYDYSTTGLGWTLHDAVYAVDEDTISLNDYIVVYSPGESGKMDLYYKFTYSNTTNTYLLVELFQYWNNSTHAGTNGSTGVLSFYIPIATASTMYIYGDLDCVIVIIAFSTSKYGCTFGIVNDPLLDTTVATSALSASSGSNVVVTVDAVPSSWHVDDKIVVRDNTNIQHATITVIAGLDVTFNALATAFTAGFKMARDYPVFVPTSGFGSIFEIYRVMLGHNSAKYTVLATTNTCVPIFDPLASGTLYSFDPVLGGDPVVPAFIGHRHATAASNPGKLGYLSNILITTASIYTDFSVKVGDDGRNYRCFNSVASGTPRHLLIREV